jgi:hypothetical protein
MSMSTQPNDFGNATKAPHARARGRIAELIEVVEHSPGPTVLVFGIFLIGVSIVRQIGNFNVQVAGSQVLDFVLGCILLAGGIFWTLRSVRASNRETDQLRRSLDIGSDGDLPEEAYDLDFMMKVFYRAMPPAFVKRVDCDAPLTEPAAMDILYSKPYVRFQDSPDTTPVADDVRAKKIRQDHRTGDYRALRDGTSIQLEFPASRVKGKLRPILTCKSSFKHREKSYVAGWYVPVDLDGISPDVDRLHLSEEIDQIKFRLSLSKDESEALTAEVGQAVKDEMRSRGASVTSPTKGSQGSISRHTGAKP